MIWPNFTKLNKMILISKNQNKYTKFGKIGKVILKITLKMKF